MGVLKSLETAGLDHVTAAAPITIERLAPWARARMEALAIPAATPPAVPMTREDIAARLMPAPTGCAAPLAFDMSPVRAAPFMFTRDLAIAIVRTAKLWTPVAIAPRVPVARETEARCAIPARPGWAFILMRLANATSARPVMVARAVARPRLWTAMVASGDAGDLSLPTAREVMAIMTPVSPARRSSLLAVNPRATSRIAVMPIVED